MTHNCSYMAASCGHLHVKYCPCCGKIYCEDCNQTWTKDWLYGQITWTNQYGGTGVYSSKVDTVVNAIEEHAKQPAGGCKHPEIISRY